MTVQLESGARVGSLTRIADWCYRHRWRAIAMWTVVLVSGLGLMISFGGSFSTDSSTTGSESQHAYEVLSENFPEISGDTIDVVFHSDEGFDQPDVRSTVNTMLALAKQTPHITGVAGSALAGGGLQVSPDGTVAYASLQLDLPSEQVPAENVQEIIDLASSTATSETQIALAGSAVSAARGGAPSEGVALIAAAVVLFIAFGSLLAMGLPILAALYGLGIATAIVGLLMNFVVLGETGPAIAAMVGMGVGIDYSLLILTRYRGFLADGASLRSALVRSVETAGRSAVFAGITVVASMSAMFLMQEKYMYGLTIATIIAVLAMIAVSVTLLPALLAVTGPNINRFRIPSFRRAAARSGPSRAYRWSQLILRHPWIAGLASIGILLALAAPAFSARLGFPDAGNDPVGSTTRQAHDLLAAGFGPGYNGPLVLAVELPNSSSEDGLTKVVQGLDGVPGIAAVSPAVISSNGAAAIIRVTPTSGPQESATDDLVQRLRSDVLPTLVGGSNIKISVGGSTAAGVDMTDALGKRLPLFISVTLLISVLILILLLRSPVIAIKAALANLLSVGAAFGVVAFAISGSWLGSVIGIPNAMPAPVYAPLLMFAILFGLSMDYEIFLMSRIREEFFRTRNNYKSIAHGISTTARVITAAAAVMVAVFAGFILSEDVFLKAVGVGMASAILIDATVVRLVLVPASMALLGKVNWWMPRWLDRLLPTIHHEGGPEPDLTDGPEPQQGRHRRTNRPTGALPTVSAPPKPPERTVGAQAQLALFNGSPKMSPGTTTDPDTPPGDGYSLARFEQNEIPPRYDKMSLDLLAAEVERLHAEVQILANLVQSRMRRDRLESVPHH